MLCWHKIDRVGDTGAHAVRNPTIPPPPPPFCRLVFYRTPSLLARTRLLSSAEPLHGSKANVELVRMIGRRPEEEDAAIAQEWSPRGGRKLMSAPKTEALARNDQDIDGNGGQQLSPRLWSYSQSPSRNQQQARGGLRGTNRRRLHKQLSRSPEVDGRRLLRRRNADESPESPSLCSPSRRNRSTAGIGLGARLGSSSVWCEDAFSADTSNGGGGLDDDFSVPRFGGEAPTCRSSHALPGPPAPHGIKSIGNLGGRFVLPSSPYRTYRAKHARLLRAHSSERRSAETRRKKLWEHQGSPWPARSKSAEGGRRGRRRGRSGMTSPLLQGERFGLLESNITGKVSRTCAVL